MKEHIKPRAIWLLIKPCMGTANSLYSGHWELELASSLAIVHNSGSLLQSNVCNLFFAGDLGTVRFIVVSVIIAGCPQGEG